MDAFGKAAPELKAQFVRPIVVSRGAAEAGAEARDMVNEFGVDSRLICVGERFLGSRRRFRSRRRRASSTDSTAVRWRPRWLRWAGSARARRRSSLRWPPTPPNTCAPPRSAATSSSPEVDRHVGRGEIGVVWTLSDRSFIIVGTIEPCPGLVLPPRATATRQGASSFAGEGGGAGHPHLRAGRRVPSASPR